VISRVAKEVVESDEAQELAAKTGSVIKWTPADEAAAYADVFYNRISDLLGN